MVEFLLHRSRTPLPLCALFPVLRSLIRPGQILRQHVMPGAQHFELHLRQLILLRSYLLSLITRELPAMYCVGNRGHLVTKPLGNGRHFCFIIMQQLARPPRYTAWDAENIADFPTLHSRSRCGDGSGLKIVIAGGGPRG